MKPDVSAAVRVCVYPYLCMELVVASDYTTRYTPMASLVEAAPPLGTFGTRATEYGRGGMWGLVGLYPSERLLSNIKG